MADDTAQQDAPVADAAQQDAPVTGADAPADDWQDKFEGQRKVNRDLERKLREAEKVNEQVRLSSLSDAEKAVEMARAETRTETLRLVGGRLVDAEVRAASAGRLATEQVEALLEGLDRSRFITDDGDVDREALSSWVGRFAQATSGPTRFGDVDLGVRTTPPPANKDERQVARSLFGSS